MTTEAVTGLALLRAPFPAHQISKLPKPTKAQTEAVKADFKAGIRCKICGAWHHPDVIHLDYVGHAALTDRLLDADNIWTWEPLAMSPDGLPVMDNMGGMWIRLTVCGVTRLGYGHAGEKQGGDAIKEVIGDALRNAAMRFGAALELWHKGDLHVEEIDTAALDKLCADLVQLHYEEKDSVQACVLWYDNELIRTSNAAREYAWSQLREYKALRSAIKANKPPLTEEEANKLKAAAGMTRA